MEQTIPKKIKVIVINSRQRRVYEKEIENDLRSLQKIVGGYIETAFNLTDSIESDCCFVDEEGLLKGYQDFFIFKGAPVPFAGNGVIVGTGPEGESISYKDTTLEKIQKAVTFTNRWEIMSKLKGGEIHLEDEETED